MPPERRPEPLDAQRILEELARHGVDFVLVGGLAAQTHGNTRMTNDVDVIPGPNPENLSRLAEALRTMPPGIDVLHEAPGAAPYADLRERALVISLGDLQVPVAGRDDLIRMKLARGRTTDLADVAALTDREAEPGN